MIPAYNEADVIEATLQAIRLHAQHVNHEVIVVDNGSSDTTEQVATTAGATVVKLTDGTIAAVRNCGAAISCAPIIVFLDADVSLTSEWQENISGVLQLLTENPAQILGSRCAPGDANTFLNRYWFSRLGNTPDTYVNSGHMITTRTLFEQIGGFDIARATAEDYDFCMRAARTGAKVSNISRLVVIHKGYPKTIRQFIKRECWHGQDDFKDLKSFAESKVALLAAFNMLLALFTMGLAATLNSWLLLAIYPVVMGAVVVVLTKIKFSRASVLLSLGTASVFYCYIQGRSASLFSRMLKRLSRSHGRKAVTWL